MRFVRRPLVVWTVLLALVVAAPASAKGATSASHGAYQRARHGERAHSRVRWLLPRMKVPSSLISAARALRSVSTSKRHNPRIVGGSGGVQGQWGFMAFILHYDSAGNPDFACSGTLVSSNVVLTAGHCAVDETDGSVLDPSGYAVVTGAADWTDTANRQVSGASQVIVYPSFDPSGPSNDAALLVLSSPVNDAPIPLWSSGSLSAGTQAWIAGWGKTYAGQTAFTALLQWAPTVVQSATDCQQKASLVGFPYDTSTNLCAVNAPTYSTGTCNGDSGGPLLANDASGTLIEIGLTSAGPTDCNTHQPDIFTAILPIESWVAGEAGAVAPAPSSPTPPSPPPPAPAPAPSGPSGSGTGSSAGPPRAWRVSARLRLRRTAPAAARSRARDCGARPGAVPRRDPGRARRARKAQRPVAGNRSSWRQRPGAHANMCAPTHGSIREFDRNHSSAPRPACGTRCARSSAMRRLARLIAEGSRESRGESRPAVIAGSPGCCQKFSPCLHALLHDPGGSDPPRGD
jgi:Trypsin